MKPTIKNKVQPNIINTAIADNIDDFVTWLTQNGIKYNDFLNANESFKQKKIKLFIKKNPHVLQYKLF